MGAFNMVSTAQLLVLATAFGTLFTTGVLVEPASAQSEACKADEVEVTGRAKFRVFKKRALEGRGSAMNDAISAWEREVKGRFGEQWAKWSNAKGTNVDCDSTKTGWIGGRVIGCTISGRPCAPAASPGSTVDPGGAKTDERDERDDVVAIPKGSRAYAREMARQLRLAALRKAAESSALRREEARQRYAAEERERAESRALERENVRQRYLADRRDR
jgi:hypothetical protein